MRTTDTPPDPATVTAARSPDRDAPRGWDVALRRLTRSADHGALWFAVAGAVGLSGRRGQRAAVRGVLSLAMASGVANSLIKPLVGRRRPDPGRTRLARQIGQQPWTSSFPSGHAASAVAFATGVGLEFPVAGAVLAPLAAAVAYSRVHVGVHYPSDVVVGALIGAGVAVLGRRWWPVQPAGPARMRPASAPALPAGAGLVVVVNPGSGSAAGAVHTLTRLLPRVTVVEWDPATDDLEALLPGDAPALGAAGGDGTIAAVAALAHRRGTPLAAFPFGTLNHFAQALGLDEPAQTAAAVTAGTVGGVDVGRIDGELFVNTASLGGYPEMVELRDRLAHRMGKWPATAVALFRTLRHTRPIDLSVNGRRQPVWLLFVGNGIYQPPGLAPAHRVDLAGGRLGVQFLRADRRFARTRGVLLSLIGLIDRSEVFRELRVSELLIDSHSGPLPPAHDGEVAAPAAHFRLRIDERPLTVYRP